jgi:hypothetical protein
MANTHPTPQDFVDRAQFRAGGPHGIEARLDGVIYDVVQFGSDAVQVRDRDGIAVATLGFANGKFVVPGKEG